MLLRITASAFNDRGPLFREQALAAIHQGMRGGDSITLSLLREEGTVCAASEVPAGLRQFVTTQLLAQYPSTRIERIAERSADHASWSAELTLRPGIFPLKRHPQFADQATQSTADPLSGILSTLAGGERDPLSPRVDLVLRPAPHRSVRRAQRVLHNLLRPRLAGDHRRRERYLRFALSDRWYLRAVARCIARAAGSVPAGQRDPAPAGRAHDRETALQSAHDKLRHRLFEVRLRLSVRAPAEHEDRALAKLKELAGALGAFTEPDQAAWHLVSLERGDKRQRRKGFLLSTEELATLWHLPVFSIQVPTLNVAPYRQLEPPIGLPDPRREQGIVTLGRTNFRDHHRPFGMRRDDRRRHLYIVGKTGMGKSTLLLNMLADDIAAGRGCCLVDPHGPFGGGATREGAEQADERRGVLRRRRPEPPARFQSAGRL
ncbi:MAG TPA: hypothetical protein VHZ24_05950 [Pirellulales bacterium]|nr:hypothetical protein [Pirellulales bacterium]